MLLLMLKPEFDKSEELAAKAMMRKEILKAFIHMFAEGEDSLYRWPGKAAAISLHPVRAEGFVVGIEKMMVTLVKLLVRLQVGRKDEFFEEPTRMRQMPFQRTDIGYRLNRHVLGLETLHQIHAQLPTTFEA